VAAGDLFQAASDLRDACVLILGDRAPARAVVRNGIPILDDEHQLVVYVPRFGTWLGTAVTERQYPLIQQVAGSNQITMLVTLTRCAEAAAAPESQEAVAEQVYEDIWLLWNGLRRFVERGLVFSVEVEPGPEPFLAPVAVVNEQGNATGWTFGVSITLAGYDPMVGSF